MTDHILNELWAIKDGLARDCGHDLRRLFDKLKAAQKSAHGQAQVVNRIKRVRSPSSSR